MASIFSKIIQGQIPSYKIAENEHCFAFLDISPLKQGHTLVVSKRETDYLFDLEEEEYLALQKFSKEVANAIKKEVSCKRIGVVVLGFEVPHAHIHLIPINNESEVNFRNPRVQMTKEEMAKLAERIAAHFK